MASKVFWRILAVFIVPMGCDQVRHQDSTGSNGPHIGGVSFTPAARNCLAVCARDATIGAAGWSEINWGTGKWLLNSKYGAL